MKKFFKILFAFAISSIILFLLVLATNQTPRKDNIFKKAYSSLRFRYEKAPKIHFYREDSYSDDYYTRVESEVYDTEKQKVVEVQIGSRRVSLNNPSIFGQKFYSTLKPGHYTIRWRVENNKNYGQKYSTYKTRLKILRDDRKILIKIKGSSIYIQ